MSNEFASERLAFEQSPQFFSFSSFDTSIERTTLLKAGLCRIRFQFRQCRLLNKSTNRQRFISSACVFVMTHSIIEIDSPYSQMHLSKSRTVSMECLLMFLFTIVTSEHLL